MSNEIPEERFITKRQLWERADSHYASYQSLLQEISNRIDEIDLRAVEKLAEYFKKLAEEKNKQTMDTNSQYQTTKKDLEKVINDAVTRMQQALNAHISKVDQKIEKLVILLEDKTDKKITERLQSIAQDIKLVSQYVTTYKTDTDKQVGKFQTDLGVKLGRLNKEFEAIKKKFKLISNGLS